MASVITKWGSFFVVKSGASGIKKLLQSGAVQKVNELNTEWKKILATCSLIHS